MNDLTNLPWRQRMEKDLRLANLIVAIFAIGIVTLHLKLYPNEHRDLVHVIYMFIFLAALPLIADLFTFLYSFRSVTLRYTPRTTKDEVYILYIPFYQFYTPYPLTYIKGKGEVFFNNDFDQNITWIYHFDERRLTLQRTNASLSRSTPSVRKLKMDDFNDVTIVLKKDFEHVCTKHLEVFGQDHLPEWVENEAN
jgi:hypothetical protein